MVTFFRSVDKDNDCTDVLSDGNTPIGKLPFKSALNGASRKAMVREVLVPSPMTSTAKLLVVAKLGKSYVSAIPSPFMTQ